MRHHLQPLALAVCAVLGLALAPAAQAGTITEGDPLIPSGLVVGNTFRLAFITSTTHNGLSADIGVYNTFVTTLANGTGSLVKDRGWVWKAMASTTTVDARDNLGLGSITGYPLYRLDNFKLADSYTDFLSHFPPFHQQPNGDGSLFVDEKGIAHGDQQVFTGTATYFTSTPALNWVKYDDDAGGGPLGSPSGKTQTGKSKGEGGNWSTDGGQALSSLKYFYAMSEPLEIVTSAPPGGYPAWAATNVGNDQPHLDTNNDGALNGVAYFMDQAGLITLPSVVTAMDGTKTVTWPNAGKIAHTQYNIGSGEWFVVQTSTDLQIWSSVVLSPNLTNEAGSVSYKLTEPAPLFVRLKVIIP